MTKKITKPASPPVKTPPPAPAGPPVKNTTAPLSKPPVKTKKRPFLLIILIAINTALLAAALVLMYFLPIKAKAIQTLASQLLAQQISQQNSQRTMFDLERVAADMNVINASLPNAETIVSFIELTNQLEEQVSLKLFTFDADVPLMDSGRNAFFPLTIIMEGSLDQIKAALNVLQRSPYLFKINQLNLLGENLLTSQIQASLGLMVYVDINFEAIYE